MVSAKKKTETPVVRLKFCGGCNPRYDRLATAQYIMHALAGRVRVITGEESGFAAVLVLAGCQTCCVDESEFISYPIYRVTHETEVPVIIERILQEHA